MIVIKLTNAFALDILLYDTHYFKLLNAVYTPSRNGTYFFDITTYDTDGERILDTYSNFLIIKPNPLSTFTVESIPNTQGK